MKKTVSLAVACLIFVVALKAQCDKSVKWNTSKAEFIDTATGNVAKANNDPIVLTTDAKTVSIVLKGDHPDSLHGDVTNYVCNWKDKQNGKIIFNSLLTDAEKTRHATITIEAVDGKITALLKAEEESTEIKLTIDSFEEAN